MSGALMTRRVVFSECGLFRYLLEHDFGGTGPVISLGMVNPSLANGKKNDPTMTRVDGFATRMGASKVIVWNPFALVAKDVRDLRTAPDPIGPENDAHIANAVKGADIHIVAWVHSPSFRSRCAPAGDPSSTFCSKPTPHRCAGAPRSTDIHATLSCWHTPHLLSLGALHDRGAEGR